MNVEFFEGESREPELDAAAASPGPSGHRRARWLGLGLLLAGLLLIVGWTIVAAVQLLGHARSLQGHLRYVEGLAAGDVGGLDMAELENAGRHLVGMRHDLEAVQSLVGPVLPVGRMLRWIPKYGGDLAAASDLLDIAVGVAAAGDQTFQALSPALDLVDSLEEGAAPGLSIGERILPVLVAAQPELLAAQQELGAVEEARGRLQAGTLSPRVASLVDRLDRYLPWFETAVDGALLAPGLLGADGPRTYLIVAQNNQEMRATGGFISGVGELGVDGGRLGSLKFSDSYAVDNFEVPHEIPPLDFQRIVLGELMLFRDANWDADFPTSARRAMDIYARDRGVQPDGLVALDLVALQWLVDAVGPIQVEGMPELVTGDNVLQLIQTQWGEPAGGKGREWWLQRKDFMGQIAGAAMDRLMEGKDVQPVKLAEALKKSLDEKHILVYVSEPEAARMLRGRNWDGALGIPPEPSDRLVVIDSNVGFNKVDPRVARSIDYRVDLSDVEKPQAHLRLTYRHQSTRVVEECFQESHYGDTYADMIDRCYWDYVRVYVPAGSRLLDGPDLSPPAGSLLVEKGDTVPALLVSPTLAIGDWAVWTGFFGLPTAAQRIIDFDYQLPADVLEHGPDGLVTYRLVVQKQPGTGAVPLRVEVSLPPGAELVEAMPGGLLTIDSDLRVDREFVVVFRPQGG